LHENSTAKKYAKKIINSIEEESKYIRVKSELEDFLKLMHDNKEFKDGMEGFLFTVIQKKALLTWIDEKAGLSMEAYKIILDMIENNTIKALSRIIREMEIFWFEKNGIEKLKVLSAVFMNKQLEEKLIKNLEKSFDKKIILENEVDESLIAGIKIQRGSVFYDFSINGNLKKLKQAILKETKNTTSYAKEP
jgi:F-type H+-transporting ATPase subunit delta